MSYLIDHFTDKNGKTKSLKLGDFLFIAPYNAQVRALKSALPKGARVGSVDKFQGQEAAVASCRCVPATANTARAVCASSSIVPGSTSPSPAPNVWLSLLAIRALPTPPQGQSTK